MQKGRLDVISLQVQICVQIEPISIHQNDSLFWFQRMLLSHVLKTLTPPSPICQMAAIKNHQEII